MALRIVITLVAIAAITVVAFVLLGTSTGSHSGGGYVKPKSATTVSIPYAVGYTTGGGYVCGSSTAPQPTSQCIKP